MTTWTRIRPRIWSIFKTLAICFLGFSSFNHANGQSSLFDPNFDELRKATSEWDRRLGPERFVVDVVCLVPDVPTFLEAIKSWDRKHFFPILIDDVEYSFKFIRAFRPARIVRYPGRVRPVLADQLWRTAVDSITETWDGSKRDGMPILRGDAVPRALGPTPPGIVLSHPESASLAGAVALAAGRFQPLWKWETAPRRYGDILSTAEAKSFASSIETLLKSQNLDFGRLGDDCDFITLAGDYPYRFEEKGQNNAFDDLILRSTVNWTRWAYAGRLMGDSVESVYRAMCSMFLRPSTTVMFNTYSDAEPPWSRFAALPVTRLGPPSAVTLRAGDRAGLEGWHQQFDPFNHAGLVLINSSGGSISFRIDNKGNQAHTSDIPESDPLAVHMIHSFSAEKPEDPDTLAGRWLANGAYVFYGSMNEPYLDAFRTPALVATFLSDKMPMAAACRKTQFEPFGQPWRLMYFGDPLFRFRTVRPAQARLSVWEPIENWTYYPEIEGPAPGVSQDDRLSWALNALIYRLQTGVKPRSRLDPTTVLERIDRRALTPHAQRVYDALLVETWLRAGKVSDLVAKMTRVAPGERSQVFRRHLETAQLSLLRKAVVARDLESAFALWSNVVRAPGSNGYVRVFTERVAALAEQGKGLEAWRKRLASAKQGGVDASNLGLIDEESKRGAN